MYRLRYNLLSIALLFCLLEFNSHLVDAQVKLFRKAVFLHHSTGSNIYGPNGSKTSVAKELVTYNAGKNYSGTSMASMNESWWPSDDNEWEHWHRIFEGKDTGDNINGFYNNYKVVIIKSCYPSSSMSSWGSASDTLQPTKKSVYNYKWHFRSILKVMQNTPDIFYVIWTNAPLVSSSTSNSQAVFSDQFCRWAKDTLEKGLDPLYGKFPDNVYIFDFFHKLADAEGKLPAKYAASSGDSHPNSSATELVCPQFVAEVFDASIKYESKITTVNNISGNDKYYLSQNYPNPFNPETTIEYSIPHSGHVSLELYDILGRRIEILVNKYQPEGRYSVIWKPQASASGVYYYVLKAGSFTDVKNILFLK